MASSKSATSQGKYDGLFGAVVISLSYLFIFPVFFKPIMAWMLQNFSDKWIYVLCTSASHTGFLVLFNSMMYFVYTRKYAYSEQYRIVDAPWPWEKDPVEWKKTIRKTFKCLFIEHFVIVPAVVSLYAFGFGLKMRFDLESYPSTIEIVSQFGFSAILGDTLFYWSHRLLHHPKLYPHIHKKHHEYNITVSIAAEYAHPIEYFLGNLMPVAIGSFILGSRMHYVTNLMFIFVGLATTIDGHCGFDFPWSPFRHLPFGGPSSYHNFHHYKNMGNYSPYFTVWDTICGTNKAYYKYIESKEGRTGGIVPEKIENFNLNGEDKKKK